MLASHHQSSTYPSMSRSSIKQRFLKLPRSIAKLMKPSSHFMRPTISRPTTTTPPNATNHSSTERVHEHIAEDPEHGKCFFLYAARTTGLDIPINSDDLISSSIGPSDGFTRPFYFAIYLRIDFFNGRFCTCGCSEGHHRVAFTSTQLRRLAPSFTLNFVWSEMAYCLGSPTP